MTKTLKQIVNESIKGWKNANRDIAAHRAQAGKTAKLVRLKANGEESKMNDASSHHYDEENAVNRHESIVSLNPKRKIAHNLYVDGEFVRRLG
jgi:hypothetical protein